MVEKADSINAECLVGQKAMETTVGLCAIPMEQSILMDSSLQMLVFFIWFKQIICLKALVNIV